MEGHVSFLVDFCESNSREYIENEELAKTLFEHLDAFCEILQFRLDSRFKGNWADFCRRNDTYCIRGKRCRVLEGETEERSFISKITHALQDWGLCYRYLNFKTDPMDTAGRVLRKVAVKLSLILMKESKRENGNLEILANKIRIRANNIVFLRQFDSDCCRIESSFTPEHEHFITELIAVIDQTLLEYQNGDELEPFTWTETPVSRRRRREDEIDDPHKKMRK